MAILLTIQEKQDEIVSEFEVFDDWMEKYEYLIDLGKDLPLIQEELKTEERLIEGCQSRVWLNADFNDGKMQFSADSEAIITKGIIGLLIRVLNDEHPETILKTDLKFISDIGLQEHLSPTRANGLNGMIKKMKMEALKYIQH
ncbi:MAG: SufE family protein [Flavobacteriales bacterium]|jgi:cysteine desulfuration protein SufE|nr:SufE family protein [Flavobacteriales bacterium]NDA98313.1 SufE family protein [Flavobacteriia bacterium]NDC28904.1 SufE family protein [Crocinitomicaceae bacterium]NDC92835.1 SufE family protein [Flavobacteriales bacterium]